MIDLCLQHAGQIYREERLRTTPALPRTPDPRSVKQKMVSPAPLPRKMISTRLPGTVPVRVVPLALTSASGTRPPHSGSVPHSKKIQTSPGCILLGITPCTAMVLVCGFLARGNEGHTVVMVVINSLTMLVLYGPSGGFLLGVGRRPVMSCRPAERLTFAFNIYELSEGPKEIEIGLLEHKLTISLAPEPKYTRNRRDNICRQISPAGYQSLLDARTADRHVNGLNPPGVFGLCGMIIVLLHLSHIPICGTSLKANSSQIICLIYFR